MAAIRFRTDFEPHYRDCIQVEPGIRRVVAENPSTFTAWGTGTYILGTGRVAIIDPGPALDSHIQAVLAAVEGETVTHLLITHTHSDHSPAAAAIRERTGAPTYGFGPHPTAADTGGEERGDVDFVPDVVVADGEVLHGQDFRVECVHTPGHISNHLCFADRSRGVMFTGDHVMGWSTSVIPPPDGRVADYLQSLRRLLDRDDRRYLPTHGPVIDDPRPYVESLIAHRVDRERQILGHLSRGPASIAELVAVMYADVRPELHEPAGRSVQAHLVALIEQGLVGDVGDVGDGRFLLVDP